MNIGEQQFLLECTLQYGGRQIRLLQKHKFGLKITLIQGRINWELVNQLIENLI